MELIDGSSASPLTQFFPTRIRIHGTHIEDIPLDVIQLAHFQLVLGFPWLARHNPRIDWHAGTLTFDTQLCTSTCLVFPRGADVTHGARHRPVSQGVEDLRPNFFGGRWIGHLDFP